MIGTRLGSYEVTASLGVGGMGEVYRAHDTKLNRDVAIKVVRTTFNDAPDRRARFTREAHILASLNHPNIAHVYGLEETTDGLQAIVMELIEGPTLADRLAGGPIPFDEARPIIDQIVSALETAHEQGIIHRDLKPANIKVRGDGTVKVLDFGLAKAMDPDAGSAVDTANSPTLTNRATQLGVILGTAAYMAPEQAKGKPLDKRADIWSFGVVIYEMLTGRRAFDAEDVSETLAAVLTRDVDVAALPTNVPASVRALVAECLVRDPKQRLRDIGDARLILNRPVTATLQPSQASAGRPLPWLLAALAGAAAVIMGLLLWTGRSPHVDAPLRRLALALPDAANEVVVSPDGRWLLSDAGQASARVRRLDSDSLEWREISGTEGGARYFWSPDSRQVGFAQGGALKTIDLIGSKPQTICSGCLIGNFRGATWNRDGLIVFADTRQPLQVVSAAGGPVRTITEIDAARQETEHLYPVFLPDGNRFLYVARSKTGDHSIMLASIDNVGASRIAPGETTMALAGGHLLSVRNGALVAVPFDAGEGKVTGDPVILEKSVRTAGGGYASFSASDEGTVVSLPQRVQAYWWVDATGARLEKLDLPPNAASVRLAANGLRLVSSLIDPAVGPSDIYVTNRSGGDRSRLTYDAEWDMFPVWSPTGAQVMFSSQRELPKIGIYVRNVNGTETERRLYAQDGFVTPTDWSPDGRHVLVSAQAPGKTWDILTLEMPGGSGLTPWQATQHDETNARFSPDGNWVAFQSNATGRGQVYVRRFSGSSDPTAVTTAGGIRPIWSHDGKALFYQGPQGRLTTVTIRTSPDLSIGPPRIVFPDGNQFEIGTQGFEVDDAGRFLVLLRETTGAGDSASIVFNWPALLKR